MKRVINQWVAISQDNKLSQTKAFRKVYIELCNSFLIGWKRTVNFRNQCPWRHNGRLYNYHVKYTQGHGLSCYVWPQCMIFKGYHVKFARFVLLAVSKEAKTWILFFFDLMYNRTIIRFGFCDIQNNQGLGKGYHLHRDLDYSGYHKNLTQIMVYCYYSFKMFPRFWLVKATHIIQHNQPLLTKFGESFVISNRWRQTVCSIEPMTSKVQAAARWTVDQENQLFLVSRKQRVK